ncbi:MAG: YdeI/OmpD-associated family protein [Cypionkella sp.]
MPPHNPLVDTFLASDKWQTELRALRAILLSSPLTEDFKWHKPVYTYDGANLIALAGLKDHCWIAFFKGALLTDPDGHLQKPGDNSQAGRVIKFTTLAQITALEPTLRAFILETIAAEKAGLKVEMTLSHDLTFPPELIDAFDADPDFKAAFDALTPGRQRGWNLHFTQAKQSATRQARIAKASPSILAGKGPNDR